MRSALLLALSLTVGLVACGDTTDNGGDDGNNAVNNDAPNNDLPNNDANNDAPEACLACTEGQICVDGACQAVTLPEPGPEVDTNADPNCGASFVAFVSGYIVDEANRPLAGAKAQACVLENPSGVLTCLRPSDSGADGTFGIEIPASNRCMDELTMRVLVPATNRVTQYCRAELGAQTILSLQAPQVLFETTPATTLPQAPDNEERTVVFSDGLEIDMIPANLFGEYDPLAVARVDPDAPGLCFLEGQPRPDALYAFSPEIDITGGFPVRIPNDTGLAPGTTVDLFILGGLDCSLADGTHVEEADWNQYGTGTVSDDGAFIVSDASGHIPCLNWFGYKAR